MPRTSNMKTRPAAGSPRSLLNVASAMQLSGDRIERIRIAVNGAAARPLRLHAVENLRLAASLRLRSSAGSDVVGELAVRGAIPLQFNALTRFPLMRNLGKRAIGWRGGSKMGVLRPVTTGPMSINVRLSNALPRGYQLRLEGVTLR